MKRKVSIRSLVLNGQDQFQPLGVIFFVFAVWLAVAIINMLAHRVVGETTLFDTDEASHAIPALELYVAMQRHDLVHFGRSIFQQSFYPPLHSLTVLVSYLIAGPSVVTTRLTTVVTFVVLLIVTAAFTFRITYQISVAGGVAFVATAATLYFISTSPVLIQNAVLSMLEILGCLWVMLLLWLCWRLDNSPSKRWVHAWSLAIGLIMITLTKYSFGVIAVPAIVAAILTGPKPHTRKMSQLLEAKDVLIVLAVGLGCWFVAAGFQGALTFALDQPQYAPLLSSDNLFYYPLVWLNDFHLHPVIGFSTVLLAGWGAIKGWNDFAVRTASWVVCFSLLILTISLNNQPRHFAIASLCVWFLAARGLTQLLVMSLEASRSRLVPSVSLIVMFAFFGLSAFQRAGELQLHLTYAFEGKYGDRNEAMLSYILANVDSEGSVLMLGLFDQLSTMAIRYQSAIETGKAPSEIFVATTPEVPLGRSGMPSNDVVEADYEVVILRTAATQAHYNQIVVVYSQNSTDPYVVAAPSALHGFSPTSKLFDDFRIDIYDFEDRR